MRILFAMILALVQAGAPSAPPSATIAGGELRAVVYLPDPAAGYYRGTRFDWSGAISSLTWNGHEYFGQWFEHYEPAIHDAIPGPVEEFLTGDSSAPGYDEAPPGGTFVRIGVGLLRKPAGETAFRRFATYEIVDPGTWTTTVGKDRIEFVHALADGAGYAYRYRKLLRLEGASLILEHDLTNTGTRPIVTSVYNHNFFTLDRRITGPDIAVRFPFAPKAARPLEGKADVQGRELRFLREFLPNESVFTELEGFGPTAADHGFALEHRRTGAAVRVAGDRPIQKLFFWSAAKTVCPEPYIDVTAAPGRTSTWTTTYTFYQATR
jgi:hypothetical protein